MDAVRAFVPSVIVPTVSANNLPDNIITTAIIALSAIIALNWGTHPKFDNGQEDNFSANRVAEDIKNIIDEVEASGYTQNFIFISFSLKYCVEIRRLLRDVKIQWLADREATPEIINTLVGNRIDLDVYYKKLTKELVEYIHSLGLEVNCWTCDDVDNAIKLIDMGVEYITTNILK